MDLELTRLLSDADRALGRLDGVASVLPNPRPFRGHVRSPGSCAQLANRRDPEHARGCADLEGCFRGI